MIAIHWMECASRQAYNNTEASTLPDCIMHEETTPSNRHVIASSCPLRPSNGVSAVRIYAPASVVFVLLYQHPSSMLRIISPRFMSVGGGFVSILCNRKALTRGRTDHFSVCCYLFTASNLGLLFLHVAESGVSFQS